MQATKKYQLYGRNPEFTRNLWQELTLQRLLVIPVILFLLLLLTKYSVSVSYFPRQLMNNSLIAFVLVGFFWGTKLVNDTLAQEFTDGTWDSQRMSGLSAMQLVLGKLFGGTVIAWYAMLILLGGLVYGAFLEPRLSKELVVKGVLGLVFVTLIVHGLSMSSLLAIWKKQDHQATKNIRLAIALPMFFACFFAYLCITAVLDVIRYWVRVVDVDWFFWSLNISTLLLIGVFFLACWVFVGVWQQMRSELRFATGPWWWLGFLLFWMLFLAGFVNEEWSHPPTDTHWQIYMKVCLVLVTFSVYLQVFYASKDSMFWLRFFSAFKKKNFKMVSSLFPAWLTSYLVVLVLAAVLVAMSVAGRDYGEIASVVAIVFFVLRDILLAIWLSLSHNNRRADAAWIFYLIVLYVLLPSLVGEIFSADMRNLFFPPVLNAAAGTLSELNWFVLSPVIQVVLVAIFVSLRWKKRNAIS